MNGAEWVGHSSERVLHRKFSSCSQTSRPLSRVKSGTPTLGYSMEESRNKLGLEKVETHRPQGEFVRSYRVPNAIVAPVYRLAKVTSVPSIEEGTAVNALLASENVIPFPIRAPQITDYPASVSQLSVQKVKTSRSIRSFWKASFINHSQQDLSEFDDNTSEEGDRQADRSKKSMFNLRWSKARDSEFELERRSIKESGILRPQTAQNFCHTYCTRWCREPRCFHDCDVLHIKTATGHDCLVLEAVLGKPTVIAGTLDGLLLELCAPLSEMSDPTFTDRFLRICGNFWPPLSILNLLIQQYDRSYTPTNQRRVIEVITRWLRIQPDDLLEGDGISPKLFSFVEAVNQDGYKPWSQELQSTCSKLTRKLETYHEYWQARELFDLDMLIDEAVKRGRKRPASASQFYVMDIETEELAKYFSALDLILFRDASENRTLRAWFKQVNGKILLPEDYPLIKKVERVLRRADMLRDWVAYEILSVQTSNVAITYIEKFIELAQFLCRFGNFQTSITILDTLTSELVTGVPELWERVSTGKKAILEDLKRLQTDDGYVEALSSASLPVVPSLGKFLRQVHQIEAETFYYLDSGNKKRHMDLNLDKCGYTHYPEGFSPSSVTAKPNEPPPLIDIVKHGSFFHQISLARQKAWRAHNFERLSRQAWVFSLYVPGRSAFCKTSIGDKPNSDFITSEIFDSVPSTAENNRHSIKQISEVIEPEQPTPTGGAQVRMSRTGRLPPTPPITPPTSTYFESKRISSINEPGRLDWISDFVEQRIIEAHAFAVYQ
ncbi:ras guanine nucleotide exchange factor domain-containing protein [Kalaharituber pfeilii]|nr:ras guanine nucleotide exchange factor domain-containing protein [Kalaharituber pfeilii]